jgi:hypothetical protein
MNEKVGFYFLFLALQTGKLTHQLLNLNIVLCTPILIFRSRSKLASTNDRLVFHLDDIHVKNSESHSSNFEIKN